VPYWPPGVPLYLVPFLAMGASPAMLRCSILLFWLLACWSLFRILKALGLAEKAWIVLLFFSILPDTVQMALEPMTQMPAAALLLTALCAALIGIQSGRWREYLLLGLGLGVTALTRPSTLPLLAFLPALCAVISKRFAPAIMSLLLGLAVFGGWVVHVHSMTGAWITNTANARNFYYGNNPWTPDYRTWYFGSHAKEGSDEIESFPEFKATMTAVDELPPLKQGAVFQHLAASYIESHPGRFAYRTFNRVRCYFGFDTFTGAALSHLQYGPVPWSQLALLTEAIVYFLFAGGSIFWIVAAPRSFWKGWESWMLLLTMLLYAAPYWVSMSHPTYHFPLLLPLGVLGTLAWTQFDRTHPIPRRAWIGLAVLFLVQVEWAMWGVIGTAL
jgi:4-amino-4-deoxy-L-arabinose transferase-like glycosyltransferase